MKHLNNQKGAALVTALSLGLIATLFVLALWFFVRQETGAVSEITFYTDERKNAQGIAEYIMAKLKTPEGISCNGRSDLCRDSCAPDGCPIDIPKDICEALGKTALSETKCSTITALYLGLSEQTEFSYFSDGATTSLHSFRVTSSNEKSLNTNAPQKAIIDIVYKTVVTPQPHTP